MKSKWSNVPSPIMRLLRSSTFGSIMDALMVLAGLMWTVSTTYLLYGAGWPLFQAVWLYAIALTAAYSIGRRRCHQGWMEEMRRERDDALHQLELAQSQHRESLQRAMQRFHIPAEDQKLLLSAPIDRSKDRWQ